MAHYILRQWRLLRLHVYIIAVISYNIPNMHFFVEK